MLYFLLLTTVLLWGHNSSGMLKGSIAKWNRSSLYLWWTCLTFFPLCHLISSRFCKNGLIMLKLPSSSHPLENKLFLVSAKYLVSKLSSTAELKPNNWVCMNMCSWRFRCRRFSFLFSPQASRPSKGDYNISNSNLIYSGSHKNKQHTQILIETS